MSDQIEHTAPAATPQGRKGGRPKLPPGDVRRERRLMFSAVEWARFGELAALAGCSVSELIRRLAERAEVRQLPSVADRQAWVVLGHTTANLNQIAHRVNLLSNGGDATPVNVAELTATLQRLAVQVEALRAEMSGGAP